MAHTNTDVSDLVDREALRQALGSVLPPISTLSISVLSGGSSNLTFLVRIDDVDYVLRRRPLGPSAARAHDMSREFTVISALNATTFPVPRAICYSEDRSVVGEPFYLMQFVAGTAFHNVADVADLDENSARECSQSLIDTLADLHAIDPTSIGLQDFGRPQNFLRRRIASWLRQWESVEHRDFPAVQALGQRLLDLAPGSAASTLVHGDYRLGNVLFASASAPRLVAVLDWEMSTIGDPLTDLAHLLVYWEPTRTRVTHPSQAISRHSGFLDGRALTDRYAASTGRDVSQLNYYMAFEHWRAAIIKDAIFIRTRTALGGEAGDQATELGDSVHLHLDEAAEVLGDLQTTQI
jgi:aminoglycoside phosphotransferase (APT) family kinase protein